MKSRIVFQDQRFAMSVIRCIVTLPQLNLVGWRVTGGMLCDAGRTVKRLPKPF